MKKTIHSATLPADEDNRQYSIDLAPGELAENIILVGDPARVLTIAQLLDEKHFQHQNREFLTVTGVYNDLPVSILSTGIGQSSTEIAVLEAMQITKKPTFIRVGTCGGIQADVQPGDFVISTASVRMEEVSTLYVYPGYPAVAHYDVVEALKQQTRKLDYKTHIGITASTSSFYAGQARYLPNMPQLNTDVIEKLRDMKVLNFEMESSIIFTLASLNQCKAGCICIVVGNRDQDSFIDYALMPELQQTTAKIVLDAMVSLS
jgi:uridine phosphorylase